MDVHVRARRGAPPLAGLLRAEVAALDPNLPLYDLETVQEAVDRTVAPTRFYLILMGGFSVLAVLLAAVGLYGVVSYHVARQTREIGVRIALGARPRSIVGMVISEGLRPAIVGVVLGLGGALAAGRVMESLLFEVRPNDPLTLAAVPALLLCVVVVASLIPAWRATRVDPVTALREE
jgi:ABC-type antimicrobial peptide transport system permease subunit